jgi:hypothetical protein
MNIVHQLLTGGDGEFADIYAEVPWIEFVTRLGMPLAELQAQLAAMPVDPRAFKTHSAPPALPYVAPGAGPALGVPGTVNLIRSSTNWLKLKFGSAHCTCRAMLVEPGTRVLIEPMGPVTDNEH